MFLGRYKKIVSCLDDPFGGGLSGYVALNCQKSKTDWCLSRYLEKMDDWQVLHLSSQPTQPQSNLSFC